MRNIYNFSAGPAVLPEPVLQEAADEMMDYRGSGMSAEVNAEFIKAAEQNGIICIGRHRAVGGMRASLYNAMPVDGVEYLVDFMRDFEARELSGC